MCVYEWSPVRVHGDTKGVFIQIDSTVVFRSLDPCNLIAINPKPFDRLARPN